MRKHIRPPTIRGCYLVILAVSAVISIGVITVVSLYQGETYTAVCGALFLISGFSILPIGLTKVRAVAANRVTRLVIGEHREHAGEKVQACCMTAAELALGGQTDPARLGLDPHGSAAFALRTGAGRA